MTVLMFDSRFADLVEMGHKKLTIRPVQKRFAEALLKAGDTLSLRTWIGRPYRNRQRVLKQTCCHSVATIKINETPWEFIIVIDGELLSLEYCGPDD